MTVCCLLAGRTTKAGCSTGASRTVAGSSTTQVEHIMYTHQAAWIPSFCEGPLLLKATGLIITLKGPIQ